ncbi:MAG: ATP-dependent DNA helicase RecG [Candidatus Korobacteraceae bacterium]
MLDFATPVQYVKGIGPRLAEILAAKGITTVEDLLFYLPFRYEDRANPRRIGELRPGETASIVGEVRSSMLFRTRRMPIFELVVGDLGVPASAVAAGEARRNGADSLPPGMPMRAARARLKCLWFHGAYLQGRFQPGQVVALYGKVDQSKKGDLQIIQPQFEVLGEAEGEEGSPGIAESLEIGRVVPIYESAGQGKLSSRWFRRVIRYALDNLDPQQVPDALPESIRKHLGLIPFRDALWQVHWPPESGSLAALHSARTPAHQRMIFEELFFLELGLELKRSRVRIQPGIAFQPSATVRNALKRILPFHPTAAQKRVLKEIAADMQRPAPMRRLLQGDVGSGKTIVALQAAIIAIENGYQVSLMAPTEILSTQHYLSARRLLEPAGYRVLLLTGSLEAGRKRDARRHIAHGNAQLVIGTHALLQEKVEFARLGLVIVDEQHRFEVIQRLQLMKKSSAATDPADSAAATAPEPDVLVMTATPIPRTLALTMYGDLDVSVLDELPPGRSPIMTRRVTDEQSDEVFQFVRKQVQAGHQAYVVYPVIEEGNDLELKPALRMFEQIRSRILPDLRIGLLHGRLDADEKDRVMRGFQKGEIHVLVATTVIEVGVDVPNATVMLVEHAERFGLAQLHQLRGRIGRGAGKSYCILMTSGKVSPEAEQRLDAMVRTTNGFEIAELDLEQRGPGEFFGTRQAGLPTFRVANLVRDREMLELAKREAAALLSRQNAEQEITRAVHHLRAHWQRKYGLVEVG